MRGQALAALLGAASDSDDDDDSMTDVMRVVRLRECFAAGQEAHAFTPGDILRHKWPSLSNSKLGKAPVLFMEYLPEPFRIADRLSPSDASELFSDAVTQRMDCVVAVITGGTLSRYFANSAEFRPHPDFPSTP